MIPNLPILQLWSLVDFSIFRAKLLDYELKSEHIGLYWIYFFSKYVHNYINLWPFVQMANQVCTQQIDSWLCFFGFFKRVTLHGMNLISVILTK